MMSGYYQGLTFDFKQQDLGMVATAQDVGLFLRALNNGTVFNKEEQQTYSSLYKFNHTGWVPGYQSIAKYHPDIDTVIIQFVNTTGGYHWNLSNIVYDRVVEIVNKGLIDG